MLCVCVCVWVCCVCVCVWVCCVCVQEKSKLDWNRFKEDEGLEHELSQQCKDGYGPKSLQGIILV